MTIRVELSSIQKTARIPRGEEAHLLSLIAASEAVTAGKGLYKECSVDCKSEGGVTVEGVVFTSRVLRHYVDKAERVFPYVATIGRGLEEKQDATQDPLEKYYLDLIGNAAVVSARERIRERLKDVFGLRNLSYLGPGQLKDWPLEEQRSLFSLLGDVEGTVGVALTESLLMIPRKSLSGIFFAAETAFHACELCPRQDCSSRKAPYNKELAGVYEP